MENQVNEPNNGTARSKRSRALAKAGLIVTGEPIKGEDKPVYDALVAKAAPEVKRVTGESDERGNENGGK